MAAIEQRAQTHISDEDLQAEFSESRKLLDYMEQRGSWDSRAEQEELRERIDYIGNTLLDRALGS